MEDQVSVRLKTSNLSIVAQFGTNKEPGCSSSCDDNNSIATQIKWDVAEGGAKSDDHPKEKKQQAQTKGSTAKQTRREVLRLLARQSGWMKLVGGAADKTITDDARVDVAQRAVPMRLSPDGVDPCLIRKSIYNYEVLRTTTRESMGLFWLVNKNEYRVST